LTLIDGDISPTQDALVFLFRHLVENCFAGGACNWVLRKKNLSHPVAAAPGHVEAKPQSLPLEEAVGQLQENSRSVGSLWVCPTGRAVAQAVENAERVFDDGAGLLAADVYDKAHTTGVVFRRWLIQAVFWK